MWEIRKIFKGRNGKIGIGIIIITFLLSIILQPVGDSKVQFCELFGYRIMHPLVLVGSLSGLLVVLTDIYASERESNMCGAILSSPGRYRVLWEKVMTAVGVPAVICSMMTFGIAVTSFISGEEGDMIALSNIGIIRDKILMFFLLCMITGVMCVIFSFINKKALGAAGWTVIFMIMSKLMLFLKLVPKRLMNLFRFGNTADLVLHGNNYIGKDLGVVELMGRSLEINSLILWVYCVLVILSVITAAVLIYRIEE